MKVLVLGSGGREHALAHAISKSVECDKVFIAPGNGGTGEVGENVDLNPMDFDAIKTFVLQQAVDFVVVGPEAPLVGGITNFFQEDSDLKAIPILGPSKEAAMLEGSKAFAKEFMARHDIPTADYAEFNGLQLDEARQYLSEKGAPIVIKADGLAAGKGVHVCFTEEDAQNSLTEILADKKYGDAGDKVVIEQYLDGIELSVFVVADGSSYVMLPTAKDYKRIGEGDTGLNTGGMGAISPVPFATDALLSVVKEQVVDRTMAGLKKDGLDYKGFLYFGLMKVGDTPYVIEYNCRMGDPETEAVLPRVSNDLLPVLKKAAEGNLSGETLTFTDDFAATVILVSGGYPESYAKGKEISLGDSTQSLVYHAGTKQDGDKLLTSGGRVLAITSFDADLKTALAKSYATAQNIGFEGCDYRKDIGFDLT